MSTGTMLINVPLQLREWSEVEVGDLGTFVNGYPFKPTELTNAQGTPVVRIQNLTDPSKPFNFFAGTIDDRYRLHKGDLLISWSASLDAFIWNGPDAWLNQHIFRVTPNTDIVDPDFLYFLMKREIRQIALSARGSTMKHVTGRIFREHHVRIPPIDVQKQIARTLLTIQRSCRTAINQFDAYEVTTRIIMSQLFSAYAERLVPLRELLSHPLRNGYSPVANSVGTIRVLTLSAVTKNAFTEENTKLCIPEGRQIEDLWLKPGDILVERANTPSLVGTAALYNGAPDWAIFPDLVIRVRLDSSLLKPEILNEYLKLPHVRAYFSSNARGSAVSMSKIDHRIVSELPVPWPSDQKQQEMLQVISAMHLVSNAALGKVRALDKVFQASLRYLFGEQP